MQDSYPPANQISGPTPEQTMPPVNNGAPVVPPNNTPNPPKKKTGLIIGIVVALLITIAAVIVIVMLNNKPGGDEKKEADASKESEQQTKPSEHKELVISIDGKSITLKGSLIDTAKSFLEAGYALSYSANDDEGEIDLTTDNLEKEFDKSIRADASLAIDAYDSEDNLIASFYGFDASYDAQKDFDKNITISEMSLMSITLQPAKLAIGGREFDATSANAGNIKSIFGDNFKYDEENKVYNYDAIDDFEYNFFLNDEGKLYFMTIYPIYQ